MAVKFLSGTIIITSNPAASRLHEIWRWDVLLLKWIEALDTNERNHERLETRIYHCNHWWFIWSVVPLYYPNIQKLMLPMKNDDLYRSLVPLYYPNIQKLMLPMKNDDLYRSVVPLYYPNIQKLMLPMKNDDLYRSVVPLYYPNIQKIMLPMKNDDLYRSVVPLYYPNIQKLMLAMKNSIPVRQYYSKELKCLVYWIAFHPDPNW